MAVRDWPDNPPRETRVRIVCLGDGCKQWFASMEELARHRRETDHPDAGEAFK